jgi:hypothetical protein
LTIPNGTGAGSTTTGRLVQDTNGGTSAQTMITIGGNDGGGSAAALPTRTCWRETGFFGSGTTEYGSGGSMQTLPDSARGGFPMNVTISGLTCAFAQDTLTTATFAATFETATRSACTAAVDAATVACTWAQPGSSPACSVTGTTATTEQSCTDTTNKMTVTPSQWYHLKWTRTGTWVSTATDCSWMVCADAVW